MLRFVALLALLVTAPFAAHAQDANVIDQVVGTFHNVTAGWEGALRQIAMNTFGILAMIQFAWSLIRLTLRRADFSEVTAELVNQIMFIGLFYWLLTTTATWGPAIINSFRQAAGIAGASAVLSPGDVFKAGLQIAGTILAQISVWSPSASVGLIICGLAVMAAFAFITATMVLALVESYFIASTSVLFMAFGGSQWTNDIAISVVRTTLGIGARLFALQLVVSIGMTFIHQWSAQFHDVTALGVLIQIGEALVLAVLGKTIPDTIGRMVGGAGLAHGGALFGAAAGAVGTAALLGSGAARAAVGIAGAGAAAGGAVRLASTQVARAASRGNGPSSAVGRIVTMTGLTAKNVASAAGRDIGRRLSGQTMPRGSAGFRLTEDLHRQEEELRANTPALPQSQRRGR